MMKSKLSMRSKIRVYWTTNPADMGYGGEYSYGEKEGWKGKKARYEICSVRKAADFSWKLDKKVGQGIYRRICYKHNGKEIELDDLKMLVAEASYKEKGIKW